MFAGVGIGVPHPSAGYKVGPTSIIKVMPNGAAAWISILEHLEGPSLAASTACASGAHAIGLAYDQIQLGRVTGMLAGGVDTVITRDVLRAYAWMRALNTARDEEPTRMSRPFDATRRGFVLGEGAGFLMLEEREHALARGATILAEMRGWGASSDAHNIVAVAPEGRGMARAMQNALADAALPVEAVDYISAHGTSTKMNDREETRAIHQVFGARAGQLKVSSQKSMLGHCHGRRRRDRGCGDRAVDQQADCDTHDQSRYARPGVRPGLRPPRCEEGRDPRGAEQFVRLRGAQQRARVRASRGHVTPSLLVNETTFSLETDTLPAALERSAAEGALLWLAAKDKDAVELPMRDLLDRANRVARHLIALGMKPGERAVVMLPTSEGWLAAFFGTLLAGGVAVPLGPNLSFGGMDRYASTVRTILSAAGARFMLGNDAIETHLPALRALGTPLEHFVRADLALELPAADVVLPSLSADATAVIQYTSGTTGTPKGVMLSHRALLANAYMIGERSGMSPSDVGVSWLPLFHDMGLVGALLTSLYWRYPLLLMPVESFLLQPRRWITWMSKKRATLSVAPNFAYQFAVDRVAERHLAGLDLSAWRKAFNGSEAVRPGTLRGFAERFGPFGFDESAFEPVYGMAENALAATFPETGKRWHTARHAGRELCSVGTPLSGVSVGVVDEAGRPVESGESGLIRLASPSLMDGYFENEAATSEVLRHGWLDTGDLGFVRDGELFVTGRRKELIIKRGRNYAPDELEGVALEVTKGRVLRAAAFGAPDEREGTERIVLVLETRPNTAHERDLLSRDVSGALVAAVGVGPDVTVVVPPHTIERTTSGKLRRAALRSRFLEGTLPEHAAPDAGTEERA